VAVPRILLLPLPILLWMVSWSAAGQGFILRSVNRVHRPSSSHLSSVSHTHGSLCSCTCFHTYHRVPERLISHPYLILDLLLPTWHAHNFLPHIDETRQLTTDASLHHSLLPRSGTHASPSQNTPGFSLSPNFYLCSTTLSREIPIHLLPRLHIVPFLSESIVSS
jgi:hypothetical protein